MAINKRNAQIITKDSFLKYAIIVKLCNYFTFWTDLMIVEMAQMNSAVTTLALQAILVALIVLWTYLHLEAIVCTILWGG